MSDLTVKGVKRSLSSPASRRGSAASSAKSRALSGKSSRPALMVKRSLAAKAPARKATKANGAGLAKVKTKKLLKSAKPTSRPKAKLSKPIVRTKAKLFSSTHRAKSKLTKSTLRAKAKPSKSPLRTKEKLSKAPLRAKAKVSKPKLRAKAKLRKPALRVKKSAKKFVVSRKAANKTRTAKPKPKAAARKPLRATSLKRQTLRAGSKSKVVTKAKHAKPAALPLPRYAPPPQPTPRQPTRDEAAALRAFEKAHREFARGRFTEAGSLFRALVEKHPGASEVAARARTYMAIAESRLRTELSLPRDADSLYDRGVIELNRGEYVAAQEMFERALKREPEAAHIHYGLAATRARLGSIESALASLQNALDLQPNLRVRAQHDQDLSTLRNDPVFDQLIFAPRV